MQLRLARHEGQCPGGIIKIEIGENFASQMTGSVTRVAERTISPEMSS